MSYALLKLSSAPRDVLDRCCCGAHMCTEYSCSFLRMSKQESTAVSSGACAVGSVQQVGNCDEVARDEEEEEAVGEEVLCSERAT